MSTSKISLKKKFLLSSGVLAVALCLVQPALANSRTDGQLIVAAISDETKAAATAQPALDPHYNEPADVAGAADTVLFAFGLAKTGYWVGFALALSQLLIFVIKRVQTLSVKMKKYGTFIVLGLSAVAGLLSLVVGGMNWPTAALVFLGTLAPKIINDLLTEAGITPNTKDKDGNPLNPPAPPAEPPAPATP